MHTKQKLNCWDVRQCGRGPDSVGPCLAALDVTSTGVNGGMNAGRLCWTVPGTPCDGAPHGDFVDKQEICLKCGFLERVRREEGEGFRFVKLAQGLCDAESLHERITQIECLMGIHDRLCTEFDLGSVIEEITRQARAVTGAQRSLVLLLRGDPPRLRGGFVLRGHVMAVDIPYDESSAVGCAAVRNTIVNVKDAYRQSTTGQEPLGFARGEDPSALDDAPFNRAFDEACRCRTHSLLAAPILDSGGRVLGVITAANSAKGAFSRDDQWFMERFAVEAALAVEKARLLEEAKAAGRMASGGASAHGLSHSLRNVAHTLLGTSYIIRRAADRGRADDAKRAWEIFDRQVKRLTDLCKDGPKGR